MRVRFTTKFVESVKPLNGQRTDYWDSQERGLGLRVSPTGGKTWVFMYRRQSDGLKRRYALTRDATLTPAKANQPLSLADARTEAMALRVRVSRGEDPAGEKSALRDQATFRELALDYIERYAKPHRRSWREDQRRLDASILPRIGKTNAGLVSPADIIRLHDEVTARGAGVEANRQIDLIRAIYTWAIGRRLILVNPASRLPSNPERSRERVLSPDEIRTVWHKLDGISIAAPTRLAIKLLLLTGQRAGEITGARADEVDIERGAWTIPGSRTKNGRTHMVPLSGSAAALFTEALKLARDGFVFPSPKKGQAMTRRALSRALSRNLVEIGVEPFTPHDLRRTVASQMAAAGIDRLVVSKVLNHVSADRDTVTGFVYDRHGYEPEKRRALERWAERLAAMIDETPQTAKVVELRPQGA